MLTPRKTVIILLVISGFQNTSTAVPSSDCIVIIGGRPDKSVSNYPIEYYNPKDNVECDLSQIQPLLKLCEEQIPWGTSGCYFSDTQQIVIRESHRRPNMSTIYGLKGGTTTEISRNNPGILGSTSASIGSSKCLSCGGRDNKLISNKCYEFHRSTGTWIGIKPLPNGTDKAASVSLGHHFYVIGGNGAAKENARRLYRYDAAHKNGNLEEMEWMSVGRIGHSAASLSDDELITCGGNDTAASTCEIYNARCKKWRAAGNMTTDRINFALVNFNGQIYAIGGVAAGKATNTVEVYNREKDDWSKMNKTLKIARHSFVAFATTLPSKPPTTTSLRTNIANQHNSSTTLNMNAENTTLNWTTTEEATEGKTAYELSSQWRILLAIGLTVVMIVPMAVSLVFMCGW